jgi:hypothetical protein
VLCSGVLESKIESQCQEYFGKIQYFKDSEPSEHYKFYVLFEIANKVENLGFELKVKAEISGIDFCNLTPHDFRFIFAFSSSFFQS